MCEFSLTTAVGSYGRRNAKVASLPLKSSVAVTAPGFPFLAQTFPAENISDSDQGAAHALLMFSLFYQFLFDFPDVTNEVK